MATANSTPSSAIVGAYVSGPPQVYESQVSRRYMKGPPAVHRSLPGRDRYIAWPGQRQTISNSSAIPTTIPPASAARPGS
jgi:hypothetical protein